MRDVCARDALDLQAFLNCGSGKSRPVLDSPKPFFFQCDYELTVTYEHCRSISVISVDS
jgi:hypothetical protein